MDAQRLSDAEWTVMSALWQRAPATARDVLEATAAGTGWAYTTVRTLLQRLVDKGAVAVEMRANTGHYHPLITRKDARRFALRALVDKAFEGTFGALVQHMLADEKLSRRERARLARLLADAERDADAGPARGGKR
jgi:BlaI family penicillinase repressor